MKIVKREREKIGWNGEHGQGIKVDKMEQHAWK